MKRFCVLLLLIGAFCGSAISQPDNARLEAVKNYVLNQDYPEVFGSTHYQTRIEAVLDADIDNDGQREIVVLFHPHYRQSAPILIYRVTSDLKVSRIAEGLAPGSLQPLTGDYLDSHNLGDAADFEIKGEKTAPERVLQMASKNKLNGLVIYDTFYHMDNRLGLPYVIDMRGASVPANRHDCDQFEFARVKQIAAGHLSEDSGKNYLAAWVGSDIYIYLIQGESELGLLNKRQWILKAPQGFSGFLPNEGLAYKTGNGTATLTLK